MWRRFLNEAAGGDAKMVAYRRRWIGYCLTGSVREHAFAFLYGPAGNGKGVVLNTLAAMMGDDATTAMIGTFVASRGDRHLIALPAFGRSPCHCAGNRRRPSLGGSAHQVAERC